MTDSSTRLYGLLGNPVSGSKSPWIHNHVFESCDINGVYLAFTIAPEDLGSAVIGLKALKAKGLSVTIPYKTDIIPFMDSIDPMAEALGAVNTVVSSEGHWRGYNTDGTGLLAVIKRHVPDIAKLRVLVLGAGGASRGICGALVLGGVRQLAIWNRSSEKAQKLAAELKSLALEDQDIVHLESEDGFSDFDLVINTTSVGMEPEIHASPAHVSSFRSGATICDIVYKPHRTRFIQEAEAAGHPIIYGIEMLIEQALLAQQLWNPLSDEQLAKNRIELMEEFDGFNK